jgi:hypothetical protein
MIRETVSDVYEIRIPSMNLTVKEIPMTSGKRIMLLRAIEIKSRPHKGRVVEMTLYETFNFSRDEKGYWAGWISNE